MVENATHEVFPDVRKLSDANLVKGIASPSAVARLETQREIIRRGSKPAFASALTSYMKDSKLPLGARVAAIFTYKQMAGAAATKELAVLTADAGVREFALRALADRKKNSPMCR